MDFGATPRSLSPGAVSATIRTDIAVSSGASPVELPVEKTVRSVPAGNPVQLDIRARADQQRQDDLRRQAGQQTAERTGERSPELREVIERRLEVDPKTRAIVLRKTNTQTGEVVDQLPDETMLKLRALSREIIERDREAANARAHEIERIA